jgi:hypothetical protein
MLLYSAIQIEQIHDAIKATSADLTFDPWPRIALAMSNTHPGRSTPIPYRSSLRNWRRDVLIVLHHLEIIRRIWLDHL